MPASVCGSVRFWLPMPIRCTAKVNRALVVTRLSIFWSHREVSMNRRLTSVRSTDSTESTEQFFQELDEYITGQLTPEEAGAVKVFARHFFVRYPLEELAGRHLSDVCGAVYQWWRFIQVFS